MNPDILQNIHSKDTVPVTVPPEELREVSWKDGGSETKVNRKREELIVQESEIERFERKRAKER